MFAVAHVTPDCGGAVIGGGKSVMYKQGSAWVRPIAQQ
jgi:hypothetical protein